MNRGELLQHCGQHGDADATTHLTGKTEKSRGGRNFGFGNSPQGGDRKRQEDQCRADTTSDKRPEESILITHGTQAGERAHGDTENKCPSGNQKALIEVFQELAEHDHDNR